MGITHSASVPFMSDSFSPAEFLPLPVFYYHDNFLQVIHRINVLYRDLLTRAEQDFIDDFCALGASAQRLYIRLLCRKGELFRFDKLRYNEIESLPQAADELVCARFAQWLCDAPSGEYDDADVLKLFNKTELVKHLTDCDPALAKSSLNKLSRASLDAFCGELLAEDDCNNSLQDLLFQQSVIAVLGELEFTTLRLLYFGNLYQDFSDFVLRDLGIYQYENYRIDNECRGFTSREQVELHLEYYALKGEDPEGLIKSIESSELVNLDHQFSQLIQQACRLQDHHLRRKLDKYRTDIARQLERLHSPQQAIEIYQQCFTHPCRERRCRILMQQKRLYECVNLCHDIWTKPISEKERQFVLSFIPRLEKAVAKQGAASDSPEIFSLYHRYKTIEKEIEKYHVHSARDQNWIDNGVEETALQAFSDKRLEAGEPGVGFYVENSLINSVFGLYFWPVIFAPLAGAFFHEFHAKPVDLYDDDFLEKRQELFSEYELLLNNEDNKSEFKSRVLKVLTEKHSLANPFVFWNMMEPEYLKALNLALDRIPLQNWKSIFDYLWRDLKNHRSGLPDLIWFPLSGKPGEYELIEVKGPGDSLQKNQLAWLEYFAEHHIPAAVLYLTEG